MIKVLIIGSGSIARKHYDVLINFKSINEIKFFSNRKNYNYKKISSKKEILDFNPDYIIICTETHKHYEDLKKINNLFTNKKILVEKPLFNKSKKIDFKIKNKIFVGYQLRYHPIVKKFKGIIKNKNIFFVKVCCNTYLPNWRPSRDYAKSYSAFSKKGGGVLLDLSHEIDYLLWIFDDFSIDFSQKLKISKLNINSEDYAFVLARFKKNKILIIQLDYFSKKEKRVIEASNDKYYFFGDLNKSFYKFISNKMKKTKRVNKILNKELLLKMHKDVLNRTKIKKACTLNEGIKVLNKIKEINGARI